MPGKSSKPSDGEVWAKDNGTGMTLGQLNNALRAGWTGNDRHGKLDLFGVGFNIATARLGHIAIVRTALAYQPNWSVVTVDLRAMADGGHLDLPVTIESKTSPDEHGTEIVIRHLKPEHHDTLSRRPDGRRQGGPRPSMRVVAVEQGVHATAQRRSIVRRARQHQRCTSRRGLRPEAPETVPAAAYSHP